MKRGTTPVIILEVDFDLTGWDLFVTFKNGLKTITVENDGLTLEIEKGTSFVKVLLTQLQTLSFNAGTECEVQIRAYKDGSAIATEIGVLEIERILMDGVIGE